MLKQSDGLKLTPTDLKRMTEEAVRAAIDISLATDPFAKRPPHLRGKPLLDGIEGARQVVKKAKELGLIEGE